MKHFSRPFKSRDHLNHFSLARSTRTGRKLGGFEKHQSAEHSNEKRICPRFITHSVINDLSNI